MCLYVQGKRGTSYKIGKVPCRIKISKPTCKIHNQLEDGLSSIKKPKLIESTIRAAKNSNGKLAIRPISAILCVSMPERDQIHNPTASKGSAIKLRSKRALWLETD